MFRVNVCISILALYVLLRSFFLTVCCCGTETLGNQNYEVELWAPFAERAVRVLMMAAAPVLKQNCGTTTKLCDAFNVTKVRVLLTGISCFLGNGSLEWNISRRPVS